MLHRFLFLAPKTREELFEILTEKEARATSKQTFCLLAGGTDLLVNIRAGLVTPSVVIDVKKVPEYTGIQWSSEQGLVLNPSTTISDVLNNEVVQKKFPLLFACGKDLASHQLRNRATVIGNVVNASPCSDMAPALLCYAAKAVLSSAQGTRTVPFSHFFTGVKKTVLHTNEVMEQIIIPPSMAGAKGSFHKLKRINGHDLGIVGVALMKKDGLLRISISSAAPTPVLVPDIPVDSPVDDIVRHALACISPISDVRCSKEYRIFMVETYIRRLYKEV